MKVGIDGYCFHRFFGQAYPGLEQDPGRRMTIDQALDAAVSFGAQAFSVEDFMVDADEELGRLRERAAEADLELMWAWGHPDGLWSGRRPEELDRLTWNVERAAAVGATVMRICAGGRRTEPGPWDEHRRRLVPLLREAAAHAADHGVVLAVENHLDVTADQLVQLVTEVDRDNLGICLDMGNQVRMLEDPQRAIRAMAPHARACHVKDVRAYRGDPRTFAFWPSVPIGEGIVDVADALRALDEAGFDGILALEIDYLHPAYPSLEEAIGRSLHVLRSLVAAR